MTSNLLVGLIHDLRTELEAAMGAFEASTDDIHLSVVSLQAKEGLRPCAIAVLEDIQARWGDGHRVEVYKQGPLNQLLGFEKQQVMASLVDPERRRFLFD